MVYLKYINLFILYDFNSDTMDPSAINSFKKKLIFRTYVCKSSFGTKTICVSFMYHII